ncbi:MAG: Crp/Fnr family transcriptional regulator [Synergistaceae bacterium]|nr:Crp/Fnr family transcriptional regulator [Synergistaceae bacterium]
MDEYIHILQNCPLFAGVAESDLRSVIRCLSARVSRFERGEFIFMEGTAAISVGVLISGCVHVLREDFWGNRAIVTRIEPGGIFGEAFACAEVLNFPVSVMASERSRVMLIDCKKIITICSSACEFHSRLIKNLLRIIADKNVMLTQHLDHVTRRSIREKLLAYLSSRARAARGNSFEIPFNRQELADYIAADRSAMSSELCRMRDEGILRFHKNHFELLEGTTD